MSKKQTSDGEWNETSIRWRLASLAMQSGFEDEQKIFHLLLDMRLMGEPLASLLAMVSRELQKSSPVEAQEFLSKVQHFVFEANFPPQFSTLMINFLRENSHLLPPAEDY
ncbi:MAG: hypothetical protein ACFB15_07040 [Cyclobacteriaceae bacterium]